MEQLLITCCSPGGPASPGEAEGEVELQILGPVDSLVPAGQTVQFLCRAVTTARTLLTLQVCSVSSYACNSAANDQSVFIITEKAFSLLKVPFVWTFILSSNLHAPVGAGARAAAGGPRQGRRGRGAGDQQRGGGWRHGRDAALRMRRWPTPGSTSAWRGWATP